MFKELSIYHSQLSREEIVGYFHNLQTQTTVPESLNLLSAMSTYCLAWYDEPEFNRALSTEINRNNSKLNLKFWVSDKKEKAFFSTASTVCDGVNIVVDTDNSLDFNVTLYFFQGQRNIDLIVQAAKDLGAKHCMRTSAHVTPYPFSSYWSGTFNNVCGVSMRVSSISIVMNLLKQLTTRM